MPPIRHGTHYNADPGQEGRVSRSRVYTGVIHYILCILHASTQIVMSDTSLGCWQGTRPQRHRTTRLTAYRFPPGLPAGTSPALPIIPVSRSPRPFLMKPLSPRPLSGTSSRPAASCCAPRPAPSPPAGWPPPSACSAACCACSWGRRQRRWCAPRPRWAWRDAGGSCRCPPDARPPKQGSRDRARVGIRHFDVGQQQDRVKGEAWWRVEGQQQQRRRVMECVRLRLCG